MAGGGTAPGTKPHGHGGHHGGHGGKHHRRHGHLTLKNLLALKGHGSQPPLMSYDPAIDAERRAAARGALDTKQDTRIAVRRTKQDLHTSLRDLALNLKRGVNTANTELHRGLQDVGFQRQDIKLKGARGMQDFGLQMDALVRHFGQLGGAQTQSANAAGVAGGGTLAAAAQMRARNFAVAQKPIKIGEQRLQQDVGLGLQRLRVQAGRLRHDVHRSKYQLRQDTRHDVRLARRDAKRTNRDARLRLQRALREQQIGNVDLLQQEIFSARQLHPGVYGKKGRKK
jgi:hypothetical protein